MSGGRMSGGRMSGGRLSGGLMSGGLMSAHQVEEQATRMPMSPSCLRLSNNGPL